MAQLPRPSPRAVRVEPRGALQLCAVLCVLGTLGAVSWGTLRTELSHTRTAEPLERLGELYRASVSYWDLALERGEGAALSRTFPASIPLTPSQVPPGRRATDPPDTWNQPTWRALGFSLADAHYFSYAYLSSGADGTAQFTARALGDLDGNGINSTYERAGRIDAQGQVEGPEGLWLDHPME